MSEFKRSDLVVYDSYLPHKNLFSVRHIADDEICVYELSGEIGAKTFCEPTPCSYIRLATKEEIKAGRRLP